MLWRGVDVTAAPFARDLGVIPTLAHLAVRHVLGGVVRCIRIRLRNFDSTVIPSRTEESPRCRVCHHCAVYHDAVVMKSDCLRRYSDDPEAVGGAWHLMSTAQPHLHLLRIRRRNPEGYATIRIDTGVQRARDVERGGLAVRWRLPPAHPATNYRQSNDSHKLSFEMFLEL